MYSGGAEGMLAAVLDLIYQLVVLRTFYPVQTLIVPYTLRHTALTRLGEAAGGDVFVLAKIAGHSSITVTQRSVHPQADAISRVFGVGTKLGTLQRLPHRKTARALSAKPRSLLRTQQVRAGAGRGS